MPVTFQKRRNRCVAYLQGEIDHHAAEPLRREIDRKIREEKPEILRMDFRGVSFMDSSGVGLVMGRYRNLCAYGGILELDGMSAAVCRVMRLSGIERIATIIEQEGASV